MLSFGVLIAFFITKAIWDWGDFFGINQGTPAVHESADTPSGHEPPSVTTNTLPTHTSHAVPPLADSIHFMDFIKLDDRIHMLSWDDYELEPIVVDESYEVDGVISDP